MKKRKFSLMQRSTMDSFSADVNVYISLAVNYRLFSHDDVSYRFNGENDNIVLEYKINSEKRACIIFQKSIFQNINHFNDHKLTIGTKLSEP